jgi:ribosomal protein S6
VNFKSEGSFTSELERVFGINENILRSIVIRQIEDKKTKKEA